MDLHSGFSPFLLRDFFQVFGTDDETRTAGGLAVLSVGVVLIGFSDSKWSRWTECLSFFGERHGVLPYKSLMNRPKELS